MPVQRTSKTVYFDVTDEFSADIAEKVSAYLKPKNLVCSVNRRVNDYAGYCRIAEAGADYTIRLDIEEGTRKTMKVCPLYVKYCTGHPRRDTARSHEAEKKLERALQLIGKTPDKGGSELVPWQEIKDFPWFWNDDKPYLVLRLYCRKGKEDRLAQAVTDGIAGYFGR